MADDQIITFVLKGSPTFDAAAAGVRAAMAFYRDSAVNTGYRLFVNEVNAELTSAILAGVLSVSAESMQADDVLNVSTAELVALIRQYPEWADNLDETAVPDGTVYCPLCDGGGRVTAERGFPKTELKHKPDCPRLRFNRTYGDKS